MNQTVWDYQPHYRAAVQVVAEQMFSLLDADLLPQVMLVGVSTKPPQHVIFEPDHGLVPSHLLRDIFPHAQQMCEVEEAPEALHRRISEHGRSHEHVHIRLDEGACDAGN